MDNKEWDQIWKAIQIDTKGVYTSAYILDHWKAEIPDKAGLRKGWPSIGGEPRIGNLGYRKNSKAGAESAGEKRIEHWLLADKGKVKIHYLENGDESLRLQVSFHNMGLGTARGPSQKIIDCFGVIDIGNKHFATAIEVKVDNEGPWYAVIENLIQVQMLKANLENLQQYFGDPPLSFGTLSDAVGIVIATQRYFKSPGTQNSLKSALDLIGTFTTKLSLLWLRVTENPLVLKQRLPTHAWLRAVCRVPPLGGYPISVDFGPRKRRR